MSRTQTLDWAPVLDAVGIDPQPGTPGVSDLVVLNRDLGDLLPPADRPRQFIEHLVLPFFLSMTGVAILAPGNLPLKVTLIQNRAATTTDPGLVYTIDTKSGPNLSPSAPPANVARATAEIPLTTRFGPVGATRFFQIGTPFSAWTTASVQNIKLDDGEFIPIVFQIPAGFVSFFAVEGAAGQDIQTRYRIFWEELPGSKHQEVAGFPPLVPLP